MWSCSAEFFKLQFKIIYAASDQYDLFFALTQKDRLYWIKMWHKIFYKFYKMHTVVFHCLHLNMITWFTKSFICAFSPKAVEIISILLGSSMEHLRTQRGYSLLPSHFFNNESTWSTLCSFFIDILGLG